MGVYSTILCALYLVPLGLYSPCIKDRRTLGPAPALIGHRGAPMVSKQMLVKEIKPLMSINCVVGGLDKLPFEFQLFPQIYDWIKGVPGKIKINN